MRAKYGEQWISPAESKALHSPEDLADNVDEISSLESFAEFRNVSEDLAPFAALFKGA